MPQWEKPPAPEPPAYDLTHKILPFLDRHQAVQILQFLETTELYKKADTKQAQVDMLSATNMLDLAIDVWKDLHQTQNDPAALVDRKDEVLAEMGEMKGKVTKLLGLIDDEAKYEEMRKYKSLSEMCEAFDLEPTILDTFFAYAKFEYQCGNYAMSAELLRHYRSLAAIEPQASSAKMLSALWGSLASQIFLDWDAAGDLVAKVDEAYENTKIPRYEVVLNRAWLLHWTLFVVFKSESLTAQRKMAEFFLQEKSLQIVSIGSTHLLRYVAALLILHKNLQESRASELLNKIRQDRYWYSDPITQFLEALYFDIDFEAAQGYLKDIEKVLQHDYFLHDLQDEFKEHCRLLIFETYCRIHQTINLNMIAENLQMERDEAEVWIVKLIQQAKLDAKIDSETHRVIMAKRAPSVYQQVLDRTKSVGLRSQVLNMSVQRRIAEAREREVEEKA